MLTFDNTWRFDSPGAIAPGVATAISDLINRICGQGNRHAILEHFKSRFAAAAGVPHHRSSNESWAATDLERVMDEAAANAPLFIEAFYDACQDLTRNHADMVVPDAARINRVLAEQGAGYEIRPPDLVATAHYEAIPVPERPPALEQQAQKLIEESLRASDRALAEGNGRQAVQEVLWLLETISTAFRGSETQDGSVQGRYPVSGWTEDYDPDLVVVGRYALTYFYSGTRDKTILPLKWGASFAGGCIDAEQGIIYRKPSGARKTHKRAEPANLLGTLKERVKEWEREDAEHGWDNVLHDTSGGEIPNMKTRFDKVKAKAGLDWMRAHDLKHTGVSILTHAGLDINVLASAMSTTAETLRKEYTHLNFLALKPKKTNRRGLDLSLEALRKSSPPSSEEWKARAARRAAAKARQSATRRDRDAGKRAALRASREKAIPPETYDGQIHA